MDLFNNSLTDEMHIDEAQRIRQKIFCSFSDKDALILSQLQPMIKKHADDIVDAFYQNIEGLPQLLDVIQKADSSIDRLKIAQKRYLIELFSGEYGEDYFERRLRIGVVHNKIGLTPNWYIGSYCIYFEIIGRLITRKYRFRPFKRYQALYALNKIISLDSQLAMQTYIYGLMTDMSITMENNTKLTQQVANASRDLQSSITTSASATAQQAAAATEQAASVNEMMSSLDEIKATAQQTLDKVQIMGQTAKRSEQESESGIQAVQEAIEGMESIRSHVTDIARTIRDLSEQSQQIGEITEAVNGLAQQSKMLALNASIEAAKAGDAGKGFAVVAAEVRELAEQSQHSTSQVKGILQDIRHATDRAVITTEEGSKGVDAGVKIVERAGEAMQGLAEVIQEASLSSQQIVAAVRQEAVGIDQVNIGMNDIRQATQQFSASSAQLQEANADLSALASRMQESIALYKL